MKKLLLLPLLFVFQISFSQISLTQTDFPVLGDSVVIGYNSSVPSSYVVGDTGQHTWNFSSLWPAYYDSLKFVLPSSTPYASFFPGANLAVKIETDFIFYNSAPTQFSEDGIVADLFSDGVRRGFNYNPNIIQATLPATYLSGFNISTIVDTVLDTFINLGLAYIDSVKAKRVYHINANFNAWGSMQAPSGTYSVLKKYTFKTIIDTIWVHQVPGGWGPSPVQPYMYDTMHIHTWYANNEIVPIFEAQTSTKLGPITFASFLVKNILSASVLTSTNIDCFGNCNGSATVSGTGGAGNYTFKWDAQTGNQTTATATGLCAGTYHVTVYDAVNDSATTVVTITQPSALTADTVAVVGESNTLNDGAITTIIQGGVQPYTYLWSNGAQTQNINGLASGNYTLTVTDNNLCQAVLNVNVPFSGTTTGIIYQNTDFGGIGTQFMMAYYYNLSAVSVGSAGNTSWDFTSWQLDDLDTLNFLDPNQTANGPNFSNANLVLARRTDTTYYQKSTSNLSIVGLVGDIFGLGIDASAKLTPSLEVLQFPAKFGDSFSSFSAIDTTIDTAVAIFDSIRVRRITVVNSLIDGYGDILLPSGTFQSIRQKIQNITIDSVWGHSVLGWQNVAQFNLVDTNYVYRWFANNEPYAVAEITTEADGTTLQAGFKIGNNLVGGVTVISQVLCNGECNGMANAIVVGGTPPYNFQWSDPGNQTLAMAVNLCQGNYQVTVSDANSNTIVLNTTITEPLPLVVTLNTKTDEVDNLGNGAIDINVTGGTAPYFYNWTGTTQTTQDLVGLTAGTYLVTVTDANGCEADLSVIINNVVGISEINGANIMFYPNPTSNYLYFITNGQLNQKYNLYNLLGKVVASGNIQGKTGVINLEGLITGIYFIKLEDMNEPLKIQIID